MKKLLFILLFGVVCVGLIAAQSLDNKIERAINYFSTRLDKNMGTRIGAITHDINDTPNAFSRYLVSKIYFYTVNNSKFTVKEDGQGVISGTYIALRDKIDVTLQLSSNKTVLNSYNFSVSSNELKELGISVEPENRQAVIELEKIFTDLNAQIAQENSRIQSFDDTLEIKAWSNSDTNTYIDGDELVINLLANKDCYFKVYHIDRDNNYQLIYPNTENKNNQLKANIQRSIPDEPISYKIQAPYGRDTIFVVASDHQFLIIGTEINETAKNETKKVTLENLRNSISIVKPRIMMQTNQVELIVTARFSFTSLAPAYYDYSFSYKKPDNLKQTLEEISKNIKNNKGVFKGDEKEGSFIVNGTSGYYKVEENTVKVYIRYLSDKLSSITRGNGFNFYIDKPKDMSQTIRNVQSAIEGNGGRFDGNEQNGAFSANGLAGDYTVTERVLINISQKPLFIPNSLIEKEIKNYFTEK